VTRPGRVSLFVRLLLLTLPVEAVVLAIFGLWMVQGSQRRGLAAFDDDLRVRSREIFADAMLGPGGGVRVDGAMAGRVLVPGARACVLDGHGLTLWESPRGWFRHSGLTPLLSENAESVRTANLSGVSFRVLDTARKLQRPGDADAATGPLIDVVLAAPTAALSRSDRDFRTKALAVGLALLALTALLLWAAIHRGLTPLGAMARRLEEVPGPAGGERLDTGRLPPELKPLAREINDLSDRLWGLVQLERRFSAEAAHELRTPITLVKSTLETALLTGGTREDLEQALQEALEDLQRLEKTADLLLEMARIDSLPAGRPTDFEPVDLDGLLLGLAERFAQAAGERRLRLRTDLRPAGVYGERDGLERLFANLIDNAVKYALSGGAVTVTCGAKGGAVEAVVENDGPSIPVEDRPHLFQPFFRGRSGRDGRVPGAGLGLAIVAAVARRHGAEVAYEPGDNTGNRFVVRFPARGEEG
jgi:signal transduction histidine kinase